LADYTVPAPPALRQWGLEKNKKKNVEGIISQSKPPSVT